MYLTKFATNWYITFVIRYHVCIDIMMSETVKFLSNYSIVSQELNLVTKHKNTLLWIYSLVGYAEQLRLISVDDGPTVV